MENYIQKKATEFGKKLLILPFILFLMFQVYLKVKWLEFKKKNTEKKIRPVFLEEK